MNPFSERFLLLKVKEVLLWNSHDTILSFDSPCWPTTIDSHYILLRWGIPAQFSSVTQSCPTLCDPMDCSMPGLPVHHQLPEFTQTHIHQVGDAIQPSHNLSSPSPPAFNLSQCQGLFKDFASGGQRFEVSASTSVLPMNIQDWFPWGLTGWISLQIQHRRS